VRIGGLADLGSEARLIPTWLVLPIAIAAVLAIFLTTPAGRRMWTALGLSRPFGRGPSKQDLDFLMHACGGDRRELARRLEHERARFPDLDEVDIHRRAIRTYLNARPPSSEDSDR
jgi:hypothetical protein